MINQNGENMFLKIILAAGLLFGAVVDYRTKSLSVIYLYGMVIMGIIFGIIERSSFSSEILLGLLPGIVIVILAFVSKEKIGYGDGILLLSIGGFLGYLNCIIIMMYSLLFSAVISIITFIKRRNRYEEIPFVPFLFLGYVMVVFL
jgi:Type IV leader peptidase family.